MKNTLIKFSSLFVFFVLASVVTVKAQQAAPNKETQQAKQAKQAEQAKQFQETCVRLKLTQEQEKQMRLVMKESRNEMKTLKEANKDKPKEEKQKLAMEQLQKTDAQVNSLLTAEQQVIWKQIKQERKAKMKQKREHQMKQNGVAEPEDLDGLL